MIEIRAVLMIALYRSARNSPPFIDLLSSRTPKKISTENGAS